MTPTERDVRAGDYSELRAMTDRLCKLMGWESGSSHKFEIVRQTCSGKAAALSIEKGNQIADKLTVMRIALNTALMEREKARKALRDERESHAMTIKELERWERKIAHGCIDASCEECDQ